jgi:hypothetical protein
MSGNTELPFEDLLHEFDTALSRRADVILIMCQPIRIAVIDFRRRSSLNAYGCTSTFP